MMESASGVEFLKNKRKEKEGEKIEKSEIFMNDGEAKMQSQEEERTRGPCSR